MCNVLIVGSLNVDVAIKSGRLPLRGETVVGSNYENLPGGKGANQASAAANVGGKTTMLGCVGGDKYGSLMQSELQKAGIDTSRLLVHKSSPTGTAFVMTDDNGDNSIIVIPGANGFCSKEYLKENEDVFAQAKCALFQLEIPLETVQEGIKLAHQHGAMVILNPAPARTDIPDDIFGMVDLITPNETELSLLTGENCNDNSIETVEKAARKLLSKGVKNVIVTLGSNGALLVSENKCFQMAGEKVRAKDTTGAGDCFNGVLAVALAEGNNLIDAVTLANKAAAISVTRYGAFLTMPTREEL